MKIDRGALIFGGAIAAIIVIIAGAVWVISLFQSPRDVAQTETKQDLFSSLFPFDTIVRTFTGQTKPEEQEPTTGIVPRLRAVSAGPISGFSFLSDGAIRYGETETGHLFETKPESLETLRISNTTIPAVRNIVWLSDTAFILQYLDGEGRMRHLSANLATSTADQAVLGRFVSGATTVARGDTPNDVFAMNVTDSGTTIERVSLTKNDRRTVFSSGLRSWEFFPRQKNIFIATAPSFATGYLYVLRPDDVPEKILEADGLAVLISPNGRYVAYNATIDNVRAFFVFDRGTGSTYRSSITTLVDKCAWYPDGSLLLFCGVVDSPNISLENWYMGLAATNDSAWIIDPERGTGTFLVDLDKEAGVPIDVLNPEVSPDGKYAVFRNKNDLSLWSLDLTK